MNLILREALQGKFPVDGVAPVYSGGEIGAVGDDTVVITFSERVTGSNYATGVTIKKDTVAQVISTATRRDGWSNIVDYVLADAAVSDSVVTWEYVGATGNITDFTGNALGNVTAKTAVNTIPA
jgi:hypothetical protein